MGTFVERMLGGAEDTVVTVVPDYIVINDGVSAASVDDISTVASPEKMLVIYDHDVPTGRPEAAAVLRNNLGFARKYGLRYLQAKGVGYQYLLNEIVKPGQIIIGGGSHGGIYGAKGALGIDVSIPELARVTETGRYSIVVPKTVFVTLSGKLAEGVSIMDAAYAFLSANRDLKKKAVEFYAPMLSQHEKEVLCGMATMNGAYTAGMADNAARDARALDLSAVKPMVMLPVAERKSQGEAEIREISALSGTALQAGQIGGFTGGTIEELRKAAALIEGKKLALGFRLTVCPATSVDYIAACEEGILAKFIDYGAQISAAGDHCVVTQGPGVIGPKERMLTTGLYTFAGAMGVADSEVYSASVESVIAASQKKTM